MRKFFSVFLVFAIILMMLPVNVQATETTEDRSIIVFEDGSYIEIIVEVIAGRATNTKNGYKTYSYYDASNNLEWQAKLSASFTYNGTTSTCTSASCSVSIYENAWYESSNSTTRSGNTATTNLVMGQRLLGVTIATREYTITLSCDKDGNLS